MVEECVLGYRNGENESDLQGGGRGQFGKPCYCRHIREEKRRERLQGGREITRVGGRERERELERERERGRDRERERERERGKEGRKEGRKEGTKEGREEGRKEGKEER